MFNGPMQAGSDSWHALQNPGPHDLEMCEDIENNKILLIKVHAS